MAHFPLCLAWGPEEPRLHIHHTYMKKNKLNGQVTTHQGVLRPSVIQACQAKEYASFKQQVEEMTTSELVELHALHSIADDSSKANSVEPMIVVDDILAGTEAAEISHAGGEWVELLAIEDELFGPSTRWIISYSLLIAFTVRPKGWENSTEKEGMPKKWQLTV